jgi:hypothetical protein
MKQANHNAVDLLLRSLARGEQEESRPGENSSMASNHLDADELNLYAENALAAPARARYTDHLADCPRCRRIVAGLAQAAGRTIQGEPTSQPIKLGFWVRFGALLSAPVVRYAFPAVLLTGILAIALIALREQRPDLVARNEAPQPAGVLDQRGENAATAPNSAAPQSELQNKQVDVNKAPNEPNNSPIDNFERPAQKPESGTEDKSTGTLSAKGAPAPAVVGAVTQPSFAPEPPPPPKVGELDTKSKVTKEESLEREAQKRREDEVTFLSKDDSPTHGPARSRAMSSARGRVAEVPAENRAGLRDKNADEEVETRTVSGRHFRRLGNAWVDTAYESSRSITNVARGSDQFRALMADEPGLRAIVQQLGGEVRVVWKNRAYRIR